MVTHTCNHVGFGFGEGRRLWDQQRRYGWFQEHCSKPWSQNGGLFPVGVSIHSNEWNWRRQYRLWKNQKIKEISDNFEFRLWHAWLLSDWRAWRALLQIWKDLVNKKKILQFFLENRCVYNFPNKRIVLRKKSRHIYKNSNWKLTKKKNY